MKVKRWGVDTNGCILIYIIQDEDLLLATHIAQGVQLFPINTVMAQGHTVELKIVQNGIVFKIHGAGIETACSHRLDSR